MNTELKYLESLYKARRITQQDYVFRANVAYRSNPSAFSEDDIDAIEKLTRGAGGEFNRDMVTSESNVGTVLNQFASGVTEGFTTLGWSSDPANSTEAIANKLGHLIGFAPDIVASILSMGAAFPGIVARRGTAKLAVKRAVGRPTKKAARERAELETKVGRAEASKERITARGRQLTSGMGSVAAKISIGGVRPFAKEIVEEGSEAAAKVGKEAVEDLVGFRGYQIRSVPMRIADKAVDAATNKIADLGLLSHGFFSNALFKHERFQKVAKESFHLGTALAASAVWKGPKAMAESALHGALAGAVFGSTGEFIKISRLMSNPKTQELGKQAIRKLADDYNKEQILTAFARGTVGAGFQGGMTTLQGAPLPDQIYEYLLGFFFGAHTKSVNEIKFRKMIMENPMLDGTRNIEKYRKQIEKTETYKESPQEVQDMFNRHIEVLFMQQRQQKQRVISERMIDREIDAQLEKDGINPVEATVEQIKEASKKALETENVKDLPGQDVELFRSKVETDAQFTKELTAHKNNRAKAIEEINKQLLEDLGVDFAELIETQKSNDVPDPISINRSLETIYDIMKADPLFEGYSRGDLKRTLLESVYNAKSYTDFIKGFETIYPEFKANKLLKGGKKIGENPLRTFFLRTITYANQYEVGWSNSEGRFVRIQGGKLEVDADGKLLVDKEAPNGINVRYGDATRLIIRLEEIKKDNRYEEPLLNLAPDEAIAKYQKDLFKQGYYIYGSPKDKGTIIAQKIPKIINPKTKAGKTRLDLVVQELIDVGVPKKMLSRNNEKLFMASNLIYKLLDNNYITQVGTAKDLGGIRQGLQEFKKDVEAGLVNIDVLKEVKYEPLYQGKGIPVPSEALAPILDNVSYVQGNVKGFLNLVAIKDKILKRYDKEYEQGTDGGLIIRDDVFDLIVNTYGLSPKAHFIKPVIRASARDNKGEIRGKIGGFRPESEGLNKFMLDNNIHMMIYGTGLKSKGKLTINELIDGPKDTWSLKDAVDVAKIKPEELLVNPDVNDFVYKNLIEINKNGKLRLYKQLLDKNTTQDFPVEYFEAIESLKENMMAGQEQATREFVEGGRDFVKFKLENIAVQEIINSLSQDPTSPRSKKIIRDILEDVKKNDIDLSDSVNLTVEDIAELSGVSEILNRTNHGFNSMVEYRNFVTNKLARYIISRGNEIKIKHGFKAYSGLYTPKMEKEFGLKDNEFMLGHLMKEMLVDVRGVDKPMRLDKVLETFQKLNYKSNRAEYIAYKEALTFLVMRTPNSGNGGVRALVLKGFHKKGGFNFFANELNSEYLGGKDNDGDTVTGYQSLPGRVKRAFAKDNVFYELNDGNVKNPTKDLKGMADKYIKGKTIAETIFGIDFGKKDTKKPFGEQLGEMLSTEMRLKAGKAALEGKKATGLIVNATTEFQMLFDMIKKNNGVIDLGGGYTLKIRLDDFNFLKDVSYVGINTAVDSSEYIKINPARDNVQNIFERFFVLESGGRDLTKKIKWYQLKKDSKTIMPAWRNFVRTIQNKKGVTFDLGTKEVGVKAGERSLLVAAKEFLDKWGKYAMQDGVPTNYYSQTAKQIAELKMEYDIFTFDFTNGNNIVKALERTLINLSKNTTFKDLGISNLYSDLQPKFILKGLKEGKNLRGKANNIIGLDLLTKQAEVITELLGKAGYSKEAIIADLQQIVENTMFIKGKKKTGIELTQEIINNKKGLENVIVEKFGKGKKLSEVFKTELMRFYDFALLAHPVKRTGSNPVLDYKVTVTKGKKKITRNLKLNEALDVIDTLNKEIADLQPDPTTFEYNTEINSRLREISSIKNAIDKTQEQFVMDSPAIDPVNSRMFFTLIDNVYSKAREIQTEKVETETVEVVDKSTKKKKTVKNSLEDIAEDVKKEVERETNQKIEELELREETYKKITGIDFGKRPQDITEFGAVQLRRLENFLQKYPELRRSIEVEYETFLQGTPFMSFELAKSFTDATAKDLKRFMDYMEAMSEPGAIKKFLTRKYIKKDEKGRYKVVGAPGWATHFLGKTLNNQLKFAELADGDPTYRSVTNVVVGRDGVLKIKKGMAPLSTLEYNTQLALSFHRLGNSKDAELEQSIEEEIRLIKPEDSKQVKDYRLLFKYTMYNREYNNGLYYAGVKTKNQKENIKKKYNIYKKEFDRMVKENLTFKFTDPTSAKGERVRKDVKEVSTLINDAYTKLLTQTYKDVIASRYETLRKKLISVGKSVDEFKILKKDLIRKEDAKTVDEKIKFEIQQLELLFLDKNGLLSNNTKIDALYANLNEIAIRNPSKAIRQLPSLTDVNFIRYYQRLNDHLSRKFPEINFNKTLTKEQFNKVKNEIAEYKKVIQPNKSIGIGRFVDAKGLVSRLVPHTGQFATKKAREINGKVIEDIIESKIERVKNNDRLLERIDYRYAISNKTAKDKAEAIARLRKYYESKYAGYRTNAVSRETEAAELAVIEDFTLGRPMDVFRSNGNLRSRSNDISMPEWNDNISHVKNYTGAQYRNLFNSNLTLKINSNIKRFVDKNPFGTDKQITESWAYLMMDIAKNQMGLNSLRNFDIHGIKDYELDILKDYIKNKLQTEGMQLSGAGKRFLERVVSATGLSPFQRSELNVTIKNLQKAGETSDVIKDAIETIEYNFRLDNVKELAQKKNVNKISRFKSAYQIMTDESVVGFTERLDKVFGGRILKDAPTDRKARDLHISRLGQNLNALEGKFEMMSLLFHPKTFLTNLYGGFSNTITDVGLKPFTDALSDGWWESNVWGEKTTYEIIDASSGKTITKKIRNRKEWEEWQAFIGIFEDMLINEAAKDIRFQKKGFVIPFEQAAKRMNSFIKENGLRQKELKRFDDFADLTLREAAKEAGVWESISQTGATFMRSSEFLLRSRTWDAAYINARKMLGEFGEQLPFDSPVLIELANRTVEASQFIYHATQRPNFANTSLGRIMTRFHPYAWNSIGRRIEVYRGAGYEEWSGGYKTQRAQRQLTADLMALALSNIFVASIFDYALSPPMNWMQDSAALLFGDKEARERAFFSPYPHPVLAPLTIVTPPAARFVLNPITALINQDFEDFQKYTLFTYAPFGRFGRDTLKTLDSPAMFGEFMFGLPVHTLHRRRRDYLAQFEDENEEDVEE